jgi:hypothetical protein
MQHETWCETEYHHTPPREPAAEEPEPCRSPLGAQVDQVSAYLRSSSVGPMGVLLGIDGAVLPVQRMADYGEQLIRLAVRGGAARPAPGPV